MYTLFEYLYNHPQTWKQFSVIPGCYSLGFSSCPETLQTNNLIYVVYVNVVNVSLVHNHFTLHYILLLLIHWSLVLPEPLHSPLTDRDLTQVVTQLLDSSSCPMFLDFVSVFPVCSPDKSVCVLDSFWPVPALKWPDHHEKLMCCELSHLCLWWRTFHFQFPLFDQ